MLGHKVFQILRERFTGVLGTTLQRLAEPPLDRVSLLRGDDVVSSVDVSDFAALRARLTTWKPEVIVNCVGVIKQREAAGAPIPTITLNALFPHLLADAAAQWGGRVVHFSTDCVFSGRKGNYVETDVSDAEDLYGRSKFLGEVTTPNAITLRTSIIGRELTDHRSLLDWFLSQHGKTVRGFRRVVYSGITTNEMGNVVARLIQEHPDLSGLFQVASRPISKHDLLVLIRGAYGIDVTITPDDEEVSDRSMQGDKFAAATGWVAPPWPEMIRALAGDPTPYADWGTSVLLNPQ